VTAKAAAPAPVVLDTDIGTDIDDTWALALLLRSPELDLKLVTTATGDTALRARLACRLLETAGRTDVAVGLGVRTADMAIGQAAWVEGYELSDYPGALHADGVAALVETVMASPEPVTLVAVGPLTNVAAALAREPRIAQRARFVGMHGCLRWSHHEGHGVIAEYNVAQDVPACQRVFAAAWDKTLTPLDTCGRVRLAGARYRAVRESPEPLARAVIENERVWREAGGLGAGDASSLLFDTAAVYLAFSEEVLVMKRMRIRVTGDGFTREDEAGEAMNVALAWRDLAAFEELLAGRLAGGARPS
jgi:inosine-uridine nucleoside N-ribohydrolase